MPVTLSKPYCSLLDVQQETKASGSEHDDKYHTAINIASRWVDSHTRRDFQFHDYSSEPLYVPREWVLEDEVFLPWPILTLTYLAVFYDKSEGPDSNDVWDVNDYYAEPNLPSGITITGKIKAEHGDGQFGKWSGTFGKWGGRFGSYPFREHMLIKGTFGYITANDETPSVYLPPGVRRACALIAAAFSNEKHVEQVGFDGVRVELLDSTVPNEARVLLARYLNYNQQF